MGAEQVIAVCEPGRVHQRVVCPFCSHERKRANQRLPTLSVTDHGDRITWNCHHCGAAGAARNQETSRRAMTPTAEVIRIGADLELDPLGTHELGLLQSRGLTADTFTGRVGATTKFVQTAGKPVPCIAFPYTDKAGKTYAYKLRAVDSKGFASHGAPVTFYGLDRVRLGEPLVIVEGEFDAHACWQAGINAVSVPNGAPQKVSEGRIDPTEDRKFQYLWSAKELLDQAPRIILGTDTDGPGQALAEELARRIGRERCWRIQWPEKDANEVLKVAGTSELLVAMEKATPWPISGLHAASEFDIDVDRLYEAGLPPGRSTGYTDVDKVMTVQDGLLYVVTGIPGSGKSTWLDSLFVNLASREGVKTAFCSFETPPVIHISRLISQYLGKPFGTGKKERLSPLELEMGKRFVEQNFLFMGHEDMTIDSILERARAAVLQMGVRNVVIDPFNFIQLPSDSEGTESINRLLSRLKTFAVTYGCSVFIVAHPQKPSNPPVGWVPTGYNISGSAHWFNRADFGLTAHRADSGRVEIRVWKCRFNWLGKTGSAYLAFDPATSTYSDDASHVEVIDPFEDPF